MPRVYCPRCRRGLSPRLGPANLPRVISCRCGTQTLFALRDNGRSIRGKELTTDQLKLDAWNLVRLAHENDRS